MAAEDDLPMADRGVDKQAVRLLPRREMGEIDAEEIGQAKLLVKRGIVIDRRQKEIGVGQAIGLR